VAECLSALRKGRKISSAKGRDLYVFSKLLCDSRFITGMARIQRHLTSSDASSSHSISHFKDKLIGIDGEIKDIIIPSNLYTFKHAHISLTLPLIALIQ